MVIDGLLGRNFLLESRNIKLLRMFVWLLSGCKLAVQLESFLKVSATWECKNLLQYNDAFRTL